MAYVAISWRPLPEWPHPPTISRSNALFTVGLERTLHELRYEVDRLHGREVVIGVGYKAHEVRLDGQPRRDARRPGHPGVEISFDSRHGHLTYATDIYWAWEDNLRAIALALEALRKIDRYGVSRHGEQYGGYAQLPAGGPDPERGHSLVEQAGGIREALFRHHPDQGGSERDFVDVQAYRAKSEGTA